MLPDLVLLSTLNGSNYPCLELIFMVPKVFEPLKFDCNIVFCMQDTIKYFVPQNICKFFWILNKYIMHLVHIHTKQSRNKSTACGCQCLAAAAVEKGA